MNRERPRSRSRLSSLFFFLFFPTHRFSENPSTVRSHTFQRRQPGPMYRYDLHKDPGFIAQRNDAVTTRSLSLPPLSPRSTDTPDLWILPAPVSRGSVSQEATPLLPQAYIYIYTYTYKTKRVCVIAGRNPTTARLHFSPNFSLLMLT